MTISIEAAPKCRDFVLWLVEEMGRIEAEILTFDCSGRFNWPEVTAHREALVRQQLECQAALRQYARFVSEKNR